MRDRTGWVLWALFTVCCFLCLPLFLVDTFLADHGRTREQGIESSSLFLGWFNTVYSETAPWTYLAACLGSFVVQCVIQIWAALTGRIHFGLYAATIVAAIAWGTYGNAIVLKDAGIDLTLGEATFAAATVFGVTILPSVCALVSKRMAGP